MSDLASLTAQPVPVRLGGDVYHVHPLSLADWGRMQLWVDAQFPDPMDVASRAISRGRVVVAPDGTETREPYTVDQQRFLLKTAAEIAARGKRLIGTAEGDAPLKSLAGTMELLFVGISKGDPSYTREKAADLAERLNLAEIYALYAATTADLVMGSDDPKSSPGPTPHGTTATATPDGATTLSSVSAGRRPSPPTGGSSSTRSRKRGSGRRKSSAA